MSRIIDKELLHSSMMALAEKHGYRQITREQIATAAGVSTGAVSANLGTMKQLRKTIVRHAIRTGRDRIVAQAITYGDPHIKKLSADERLRILQSVL